MDMYVEFLRYYGFEVIGASDARDGLTAAPSADVIVTGILLATGTNGVELIARLRRNERTSQTPIIVLTACAWNTERERAERAGRDVFLSKPCLPSDLLHHVRRLLAESRLRRVRGTPIKAGPLKSRARVSESLATRLKTTQLRRLKDGDTESRDSRRTGFSHRSRRHSHSCADAG
jgi:DNA-binding response OmpR family regulator